jgi:GrpB-like predicted nucleotidyltransferase (UPF0157 family)
MLSISLAEHDPRWADLFDHEAPRIRALLGPRALRIEHAGSTAVPHLAAKPIIDIILEVPDSADETTYCPPLEAAGYKLRIREPHWYQHRMFKGPETTGQPAGINLHVFSQDCPEIDRMLRFRDWLRTHSADRDLYERTKRALAQKNWDSVDNYADAKTQVINEIMERAHAG